jgi:hypothetical protein
LPKSIQLKPPESRAEPKRRCGISLRGPEGEANGKEILQGCIEVRPERDAPAQEGHAQERCSSRKVKSRKQAIAIGLSEARKKGAKVPRKRSSR